jgi:hypothetical protein
MMAAMLVVLATLAALGITPDCTVVPKGILVEPRVEFTGRYRNNEYRFVLIIPDGLTGYDSPDPSPHHGFGLVLDRQESYLYVDGARTVSMIARRVMRPIASSGTCVRMARQSSPPRSSPLGLRAPRRRARRSLHVRRGALCHHQRPRARSRSGNPLRSDPQHVARSSRARSSRVGQARFVVDVPGARRHD